MPWDTGMAALWPIHCEKFLKTDSANRVSCSDNRFNADSSDLCCGLTASLLTTSEKATTPEEPTAPAVTFPTSHQRSGQTAWMARMSGSEHPAHTGWQPSALRSSWRRELRCSCQRHSSSPRPGECRASERCCPVSPAPHTCLLFSSCLTQMFLASSLLWQSLRFRSWVSQGQEPLNCAEPQPKEYSRMNCGTCYEGWPFTGQECTWVGQFKKVQVIHMGGDNS